MVVPPRDPNGWRSLARSSCTIAVGTLNVSTTGFSVGSPNGQTRHGGRGRQVALEQRRRHRQHAGDVVEPVRIGLVGDERSAVHVERQQIADGVRVFGAIQAVHGHAAGIRRRFRRGVERGFERGNQAAGTRHRPAGARRAAASRACAACARPSPRSRRVARAADVGRVEHQPAGLQPRVVAGQAVFVEDSPAVEPPRPAPARPGCRRPAPTQTNTTGWPWAKPPKFEQNGKEVNGDSCRLDAPKRAG